MKRIGITVDSIFNKYDLNNNQMLSAAELQAAVKGEMNIDLNKDEVSTMHEFFLAQYRRNQVRQSELRELLDKETIRKYRVKEAKVCLTKMKNKFAKTGNETVEKYLTNFGKSGS